MIYDNQEVGTNCARPANFVSKRDFLGVGMAGQSWSWLASPTECWRGVLLSPQYQRHAPSIPTETKTARNTFAIITSSLLSGSKLE